MICLFILCQITNWKVLNRMNFLPAVFELQTMFQLNQLRRAHLQTNEVNLYVVCWLYIACCIFPKVYQPTEPTLAIKFTDFVILSSDCCPKPSMSIQIFQMICLFILCQITNWKVLNCMKFLPAVYQLQIMCQLN